MKSTTTLYCSCAMQSRKLLCFPRARLQSCEKGAPETTASWCHLWLPTSMHTAGLLPTVSSYTGREAPRHQHRGLQSYPSQKNTTNELEPECLGASLQPVARGQAPPSRRRKLCRRTRPHDGGGQPPHPAAPLRTGGAAGRSQDGTGRGRW